MAFKTLRTYVGDGVATIYSIDFQLGYINKDYVYVYLTTDAYTTQVAYTWLNASQIEITTAVADGVSFNIRRVVPRDKIVNDYTDGAILREINLDNSYKQALMWLEEVEDGFVPVEDKWYLQNTLDMLQNHIINLPKPVDASSPLRLQDLQDFLIGNGSVFSHPTLTDRDTIDSHPIEAITGLAEIIEEIQMAANSADITSQPNYPYEWNFPVGPVQQTEMERTAGNNSIGAGGSTWWVRPVSVGRVEDGVDTVYVGTTFGSPENRDLDTTGMDATLGVNKSKGEAVISLARVTIEDVSGTDYVTYSKKGLIDRLTSYREDEHHQPCVWFNGLNGQVLTTWGNRNSARTQEGVADSTNIAIKYGQKLNSLSKSEVTVSTETANYGQGFFAGSTSFVFKRVGVGRWDFSRGSGGQNYEAPTQFNNESDAGLTGQFYFAISHVDKSETNDPSNEYERSITHIFGNPHPTNNPLNQLLYARGTYIPAGTNPTDAARNDGGLFISKLSDGTALGGVDGRLDSSFTAFDLTEMDVAYTPPTGYKTRLLDVQYGDAPRAIIAQWADTWDLPETMPLGTTYDLILVEFDGTTTTTTNIATNVRGDLGYNKFGVALNSVGGTNGLSGIEGTTYAFGASFFRGINHYDLRPVIYYADRVGNDITQHRLHKVTMTDDYSAVSTDAILLTQKNIIYRPEMTVGGNKRFLWYNEAQGWSSYNSWVAEHRWLDLTAESPAAAPVFSKQPVNVTVVNTETVDITSAAVSYGGSKLTYAWWFKNSGDSVFSLAAATTSTFTLTGSAAANGRQYYCIATNDVGSTQSNTITATVT